MTSPVRATPVAPRPRKALGPPERHLEVVGRPARRPRRPGVLVAVAVAALFATFLSAALMYSQVVSAQSRLDRVDARIRAEQEQLVGQRVVLAQRRSPTRIAAAAAAQGMVVAASQRWVSADGSASVTTGGPASAAPPVATTVPTSTPDRSSGSADERAGGTGAQRSTR